MVSKQDIQAALNKMILSVSGWRGVFALSGNEEDTCAEISQAHKFIASAAAFVFAEYLGEEGQNKTVLLASDTRPTGAAIIDVMIPVLLAHGCEVRYAGFAAAPEIMAWARNDKAANMEFTGTDESLVPTGFIYISASHNPIGHNGIKFGLADGGVLAANEAEKLIEKFCNFINQDDCIKKIEKLVLDISEYQVQMIHAVSVVSKVEALRAYHEFCAGVAFGDKVSSDSPVFVNAVTSIVNKNIGIVCDFNGSARTESIDKDFFTSLGLKFKSINNEPGLIVHRIVPEGDALDPCKQFLEEVHAQDPSFVIGYVPDCDGDRGNVVIWDDAINKARALEAQEVFALACVAELANLQWLCGISGSAASAVAGAVAEKKAIAINDPTSLRIDRIAENFGADVFRAEVGEANVVSLARVLREKGYVVRILGEGSAGGNITHPSAVRDPINTVIALVKLLAIRGEKIKEREERREKIENRKEKTEKAKARSGETAEKGLFDIWCEKSGQTDKYRDDFTLADVIDSLPKFISTPAYSQDAVLQINTKDHALLKNRYKEVFLREWEQRKEELKTNFGFYTWEAASYNGMEERRNISNFEEAGKGGLKIRFFNKDSKECAFIWMRGSATEPVFRIMAEAEDVNDKGKELEQLLLTWQYSMITEADKA